MNFFRYIGFVNGLTGLCDMPFYMICDIMGYWPFGTILGSIWASYDNNINVTTSLHMLYMAYVRLRSVKSPNGYKFELLCRRPWLVMLSFWATGTFIENKICTEYQDKK